MVQQERDASNLCSAVLYVGDGAGIDDDGTHQIDCHDFPLSFRKTGVEDLGYKYLLAWLEGSYLIIPTRTPTGARSQNLAGHNS
jgi:hypothetical protein